MPTARLFFVLLLLGFATTSRAEDTVDPCDFQHKEMLATPSNTIEYPLAKKDWEDCMKKQNYIETRKVWAASLDKLPNGEWIFLTVSEDGTLAVFATFRNATREENVVSVWQRWEYRDQQPDKSRSAAVREMYDCVHKASKPVLAVNYAQNNLGNQASSKSYEEKWVPVVPGTLRDQLLDWACKSVPRAQTAKP